jgi:hypothetical protein
MSVRSGNMQNVFPESSPSSKAKGRKSKAAEDPRDARRPHNHRGESKNAKDFQ